MTEHSFERLQALKNQVATARSSQDRLEGSLASDLVRLEELGAGSSKEGTKMRDDSKRQEDKLNKQVDDGVEALEQRYEW